MNGIGKLMKQSLCYCGIMLLSSGLLRGAGAKDTTTLPGAGASPLELRGMMISGDIILFSVYNPEMGCGVWLGINESAFGITILRYDASNESAIGTQGGRPVAMRLRTAKILPANLVIRQDMNPNGIGAETLLDERRRLDAISRETIRRGTQPMFSSGQ